jgi:ER-derived vesicles protein
MAGALLLLLAEAQDIRNTVFSGLLAVETNEERRRNKLVLFGRIMIICMFVTLLHGQATAVRIMFGVAGTVLAILLLLGFKAKLVALSLALLLLVANFVVNPFWREPTWSSNRDFLKYDFFQTLSVIGGLVLLVDLGAGAYSVDENKKRY